MPDVPSPSPAARSLRSRSLAVLALVPLLVLACGDGAPAGSAGTPGETAAAQAPAVSQLPQQGDRGVATASGDIAAELCRRLDDVASSLTTMRAVELRVPNRVALDIELGQLQVAVGELQDAELGVLEDELETPLTRLGYRLGEVELAVEDFRTHPRPQRAVPHVEKDTQTFADELAALTILARC